MFAKVARVALSVAVLGVVGLSSGFVDSSPASATTTPRLYVTPSQNLHNHERVAVRGTGFTPGVTVYIVECLRGAKGADQCDVLHAVPAKITATGLLPKTNFAVATGKVGYGKKSRPCGTSSKNLTWCDISAGTATGTETAVKPIAFKKLT